MKIVMISIPQRNQTRIRTLNQLKNIGLSCDVIVSKKKLGLPNHTDATIKALKMIDDNEHLLFLEDDLDISPRLIDILDFVKKENKSPVALYVPGKTFLPSKIKQGLYNPGIYKLINQKRFFGSQAFFLSRNTINTLLNNWQSGVYFDNQIALLPSVFGFFPNPIQHYGANLKSMWSSYGKPHISETYE